MRRLPASIVPLLLGLMFTPASLACICGPQPGLDERYEQAAVVLHVLISDVRPVSLDLQHNSETDVTIYLEVLEAIKGQAPASLAGRGRHFYHSPFEDAQLPDTCDPGFRLGGRYLLFLGKGETSAEFSICSDSTMTAAEPALARVRALREKSGAGT